MGGVLVTAGADVWVCVFQERTDVFQRFSASPSGVLLCTVSVPAPGSPATSSPAHWLR